LQLWPILRVLTGAAAHKTKSLLSNSRAQFQSMIWCSNLFDYIMAQKSPAKLDATSDYI